MNEINFLPKAFIDSQKRKHRVYREVFLLLAVAMCMFGWYAMPSSNLVDLENHARMLKTQVEVSQTRVQEATRLRTERKILLDKVRVQRELAQPVSGTVVIATIGQLMPDELALSRLEFEVQRPKREKVSKKKKKSKKVAHALKGPHQMVVKIVGVAPNDTLVATFMQQLTDHVLFEKVKLNFSRATEIGDMRGREFRIELQVPFDRDYHAVDNRAVASVEVSDEN